MKILAIAFVYNEITYLPQAVSYYQKQGCEIYVIDNYSTDGTWEWLQAHNIPSHRFDTQGAFVLGWLQTEMIKTLDVIQPDWFIWFSPDLFHVFEHSIKDTLLAAYSKGFNQIQSRCFCFKNTGEVGEKPIFSKYGYAHENHNTTLISRYFPHQTRIQADTITIPHVKKMRIGIILEYGGCKSPEIQEIKLERRRKAWELGEPYSHGSHYRLGKSCNWVYPASSLMYAWAEPGVWELLQKLIQDVTPHQI